jgi:hypothetical protein
MVGVALPSVCGVTDLLSLQVTAIFIHRYVAHMRFVIDHLVIFICNQNSAALPCVIISLQTMCTVAGVV